MNIALLRLKLELTEINQLAREFPEYLFLSNPESSLKEISLENWSKVEILFGSKLSSEELEAADQLSWIHAPSPSLQRLPVSAIQKRGNILISNTREENSLQIAEYVMAIALSYTKELYNWKEACRFPALLMDAKWRGTMGSLKSKTFLQIGMNAVGVEIARHARFYQMEVIGVSGVKTFHPYCHKNLSIKELHSLLPNADIVSIHLPRSKDTKDWFTADELKLLKPNSILIITGGYPFLENPIDPALFEPLLGAAIDIPYHTPLSPASALWNVPNLLITPNVAPRPKSKEREAFRLFRYNLRQYIHGNFGDMKNLIDPELILET
ncbi:MAG: NAD(P)-dependent oxidoreductase [Parachlamydiaceae bacterium]